MVETDDILVNKRDSSFFSVRTFGQVLKVEQTKKQSPITKIFKNKQISDRHWNCARQMPCDVISNLQK